jgi:hypothetical protein
MGDCVHQQLGRKRLVQIGDAAGCERLAPGSLIVERGHEDDGNRTAVRRQAAPQLDARHAAEVNVEQKTSRGVSDTGAEQPLRRRKTRSIKPLGGQQPLNCLDHTRVVVDDYDELSGRRHVITSARTPPGGLQNGAKFTTQHGPQDIVLWGNR